MEVHLVAAYGAQFCLSTRRSNLEGCADGQGSDHLKSGDHSLARPPCLSFPKQLAGLWLGAGMRILTGSMTAEHGPHQCSMRRADSLFSSRKVVAATAMGTAASSAVDSGWPDLGSGHTPSLLPGVRISSLGHLADWLGLLVSRGRMCRQHWNSLNARRTETLASSNSFTQEAV